MRIFILMLICVYMSACSLHPANRESRFRIANETNGTVVLSAADNASAQGIPMPQQEKEDGPVIKTVKIIGGIVLLVVVVGLVVLTYVPAQALR